MFKKFENSFTGTIFSVCDIDVATAKYIGIFEFPNGEFIRALRSPKELEADHYYEVRA